MDAVADSEGSTATARPRAAWVDGVLLGVLALFALLWLSRFFYVLDDHRKDEGLLTEAAYRMLAGETLYRDYLTHVSPVPVLAVYPFYRVLGVRVLSHKIPMVLQFVVLSWLVYLVGRRFAGPGPSFAAAFTLLGFNAMGWPIISHHWLSALILLLFYWLLLRVLEAGRSLDLGLVGASMALAFLATPNAGGAAFLVFLGFLAARADLRRRALIPVATGVAAICLPFLAWLSTGSLGAYFRDTLLGGLFLASSNRQVMPLGVVLIPFQTLAEVLARPGLLLGNLHVIWAQFYSLTALGGVFLGLALAVGWALWVRLLRRDGDLQLWILAGLAAVFATPLLAYHLIPSYTNFVAPFLYLLALNLGVDLHRRCGSPRGRRVLAVVGLVLVLGVNSFWPAVGLYLRSHYVHPIAFRAGTLYSQSEEEARNFREIQELVETTTPAGRRIFYSPLFDQAGLSPLLGRLNAAPFFNLVEFLGDPESHAVDRVLESVDRHRPNLLLLAKVNPEAASDRPFAEALLGMYRELTPGFQPVTQTEDYLVLVRKGP